MIVGNFAIVASPLFRHEPELNRGRLLYPLRLREAIMNSWPRHLSGKRLIILSHTPPRGCLDLAVRYGRRQIGDPMLRELLESSKTTLLCVCGHVHCCGGQVEKLGATTVINAASRDRPTDPGRVARIPIRRGRVVAEEICWYELR